MSYPIGTKVEVIAKEADTSEDVVGAVGVVIEVEADFPGGRYIIDLPDFPLRSDEEWVFDGHELRRIDDDKPMSIEELMASLGNPIRETA